MKRMIAVLVVMGIAVVDCSSAIAQRAFSTGSQSRYQRSRTSFGYSASSRVRTNRPARYSTGRTGTTFRAQSPARVVNQQSTARFVNQQPPRYVSSSPRYVSSSPRYIRTLPQYSQTQRRSTTAPRYTTARPGTRNDAVHGTSRYVNQSQQYGTTTRRPPRSYTQPRQTYYPRSNNRPYSRTTVPRSGVVVSGNGVIVTNPAAPGVGYYVPNNQYSTAPGSIRQPGTRRYINNSPQYVVGQPIYIAPNPAPQQQQVAPAQGVRQPTVQRVPGATIYSTRPLNSQPVYSQPVLNSPPVNTQPVLLAPGTVAPPTPQSAPAILPTPDPVGDSGTN